MIVIDVEEFERLTGGRRDFKAFLQSAPDLDALEIERSRIPAPSVDLVTSE